MNRILKGRTNFATKTPRHQGTQSVYLRYFILGETLCLYTFAKATVYKA